MTVFVRSAQKRVRSDHAVRILGDGQKVILAHVEIDPQAQALVAAEDIRIGVERILICLFRIGSDGHALGLAEKRAAGNQHAAKAAAIVDVIIIAVRFGHLHAHLF